VPEANLDCGGKRSATPLLIQTNTVSKHAKALSPLPPSSDFGETRRSASAVHNAPDWPQFWHTRLESGLARRAENFFFKKCNIFKQIFEICALWGGLFLLIDGSQAFVKSAIFRFWKRFYYAAQ
jgi:hypothetical protein